jgi:glycerol uptake facilitator protein
MGRFDAAPRGDRAEGEKRMSNMEIFWGEIVGTGILILLGGGVNANVSLSKTYGNSSGWIVISAGWGLAVAMAAYSVASVSGAHLNPAVTVGLAAIGSVPWSQVPLYIIAQMIGAIGGATLVYLAYYPHWAETDDPGAKLGVFSTGPAVPTTVPNFLCEVIGTAMLLFGILAIGANTDVIKDASDVDMSALFGTGINPLLVGFLVWAIGMSLGGPTGYAINPARDLGPRIAHAVLPIPGKGDSNWGYAWIPVAGPIVGGVLGALLFKLGGVVVGAE